MNPQLQTCLDDLAGRLDDDVEQANRQAWTDFLENRCEEDVFAPPLRPASPPAVPWPDININDAAQDVDLMVLRELKTVSDKLAAGAGSRLNVRCNYGTCIMPSLFGCDVFTMPRETNTLPAARPMGPDAMDGLLDAGVPDPSAGLGRNVLDCGQRFQEVFAAYPKIGRHVELYHPDMQGPIDILEVLWGSEFFLAFYDDPDKIRALLELITDTYERFAASWFALAPAPEPHTAHWGLAMTGKLMIRNDSLMNLSPQIYVDFVRPMDQRLIDRFGQAGAVHFCGRGDHFIEAMSEMNGLTAINLSQPEYNDMETIYRNTVDKGIKLIGLRAETAESAGRPLRGQVASTSNSGGWG